jgi:threonine synthase
MKNEIKPIAIYFAEQEYKNHLKQFEAKKEIEKQIVKEFKKLLNSQLEPIDFENVIDEFYTCLELQKKEVNTMNLKGNKLASLLDIDVNRLLALQSQYNLLIVDEPKAEYYTTYATKPEEIERYNVAMDVIKTINKAKAYTSNFGNLTATLQAFSPMLNFSHLEQNYTPNIQFILNTLR